MYLFSGLRYYNDKSNMAFYCFVKDLALVLTLFQINLLSSHLSFLQMDSSTPAYKQANVAVHWPNFPPISRTQVVIAWKSSIKVVLCEFGTPAKFDRTKQSEALFFFWFRIWHHK